MILIELLIFLSSAFPIFHLFNALLTKRIRARHRTHPKSKMFSVLIPCYNEEDSIEVSVQGMLAMAYDNCEIIYINDGSKDHTFSILEHVLQLVRMEGRPCNHNNVRGIYNSLLHPRFYVIDKYNGGKSDALNAGIAFSLSNLIVTLDADSILHKDALTQMNALFEDRSIAAAGGSIHILQGYDPAFVSRRIDGKKRRIIALQMLDYLKGFYIYKLSLAKQNATAIVSGAFGVFRADVLRQIGGYRKTLGEDIDITIRIQRYARRFEQKVVYLPRALCYTQCPETWNDLTKQRMRWQKGFINCMGYHLRFILKTFLFQSMSFHLLVEAFWVGICSCVFTILTYLYVAAFVHSDVHMFAVFLIYFAFSVVFNLVYDLCSVIIGYRYHRYPSAALRQILLAIPLDIVFFRYFNLITYLVGTVSYVWNKRQRENWNKVRRVKRQFVFESRG